jgi:N-acyl-D-amino-acid deacylase
MPASLYSGFAGFFHLRSFIIEVKRMYSLVIRNGTVVDGTGREPYHADVALCGDRIAAIGPKLDDTAQAVLDADGLMISPGFIDIHSHSDTSIFRNPLSNSKLLQGVTTEVVGNCGIGLFPVVDKYQEALLQYLAVHETTLPHAGITWNDFAQYTAVLEEMGLGVNIAPLVGHGTLRLAVMGADNRLVGYKEQQRMNALLTEALQQGAWGLSTGLIYQPGSFADTKELIELARVVAGYQAIFTSHIRSEGDGIIPAINEVITIGRQAGVRIQVSHLKAIGRNNWGKGLASLQLINAARNGGIDIGADQYPYAATSTSLTALLPDWVMEGGADVMLTRLESRELWPNLMSDISREMSLRGGSGSIMIAGVRSNSAAVSGKTLAEIANGWGCSGPEAVIRLLAINKAFVSAVYFSLSDEEVTTIGIDANVAYGSDGWGLDSSVDGADFTHPRSYGTFPRVLRSVRECQLLSWEQAIGKMTALPAMRMRMTDRGIIQPGRAADITIFDPETVGDCADFADPHRYSQGIIHVFVNGLPVVQHGRITGNTPGRVLRKI